MSLEFKLWRKHGRNEDLRGLGGWSITPYVHGRYVSYYVFF
jgi:hypothetical protein